MNIEIRQDYPALCEYVGQQVIQALKNKPDALVCIAGGDTPLGVFKVLVEASQQGLDLSRAAFVGLDEWLGLGREDKGSCREMVYSHLFDKLPLRPDQICFFDGLTADPQAECERVDAFIAEHGHIDTLVLGIGMNGHIGFNEPGTDLNNRCHIVPLDPITKAVSVKYFGGARDVTQGISQGLKTLLEAQQIIVMANGEKKAEIVATTLNSEPTTATPSTLVKNHAHCTLALDTTAASLIKG